MNLQQLSETVSHIVRLIARDNKPAEAIAVALEVTKGWRGKVTPDTFAFMMDGLQEVITVIADNVDEKRPMLERLEPLFEGVNERARVGAQALRDVVKALAKSRLS
jgi:hypothetical protein